MSDYSTTTYFLRFSDDNSAVEVARYSDSGTQSSFNIDGEKLKIFISSSTYHLTRDCCQGCYLETFNIAEADTFTFSTRTGGGAGIIDIRIEKSSQVYAYHMDICPITIENADGILNVQSPCTGQCQAPASGCRTIS